jgi:hypothetical protein
MTRKVGQVSTSSLELTEGRGPGCGSAASLGWTWWPRSGSMWDLRSREAYVPGALRLLDPVCSIDPESANTWRAYVRNPRPNSHTSGALSGSSRSCRGSGRRDPCPCLCRRTRLSIDLPAGVACAFDLGVEGTGDKRIMREFTDRNGNVAARRSPTTVPLSKAGAARKGNGVRSAGLWARLLSSAQSSSGWPPMKTPTRSWWRYGSRKTTKRRCSKCGRRSTPDGASPRV